MVASASSSSASASRRTAVRDYTADVESPRVKGSSTAVRHSATLDAKIALDKQIHRPDHKTFSWSETDEPHASRRKAILAKHPEIKQLFGPEPLTLPLVFLIVGTQIAMAWAVTAYSLSWPALFFLAYSVGGTLNHSLQLAVHELSHNLAFPGTVPNQLLALIANMPTGFASAITFTKYHMDHHQFQGVDGIDTDIPVPFELNNFTNTLYKIVWVFCQPLFYAFRPVLVKPKPFGKWELFNWIAAISFDLSVYYYLGPRSLVYLFSGTLLGLGLHPSAGHFIAEHYEFVKGTETYSYYGFWNFFNWNVGYHNEHHDFPKVPWSRLPAVKRMAPEFYDNLPHYTSYLSVFYRYITDDEIGPFARIKRVAPESTRSEDREVSSPAKISPLFRIAAVTLMSLIILFSISAVWFF